MTAPRFETPPGVVPLLVALARTGVAIPARNVPHVHRLRVAVGGALFARSIEDDPGLLLVPTSEWWGLKVRTLARYAALRGEPIPHETGPGGCQHPACVEART